MTITDDSAFILTRIAELSRELSEEQMFFDVMIAITIIGIGLFTAGYLLYKHDARQPIVNHHYKTRGDALCYIGLIAGIFGIFGVLLLASSIPFIESELDSLVMAYETLYGPIPEGML